MIERLRVRIPAGAAGEFSSPESTLCAYSYSVSFPPTCYCSGTLKIQVMLPKLAYTFDPTKSEWADYATVQAECGNLSGNELTRNLSGNIRPQSCQLAELLWTDPGLKSGISVCELISTLTTTKTQAGNELLNILPKSLHARKKPTPPLTGCVVVLGLRVSLH